MVRRGVEMEAVVGRNSREVRGRAIINSDWTSTDSSARCGQSAAREGVEAEAVVSRKWREGQGQIIEDLIGHRPTAWHTAANRHRGEGGCGGGSSGRCKGERGAGPSESVVGLVTRVEVAGNAMRVTAACNEPGATSHMVAGKLGSP
jgi:hypothetical protein